jgi:mRNA-degrading endonuclease toxin of MazEF toxin-antitoxin module
MTRGDVVLIDWQFSDRRGSKLRPGVVVQADFLNALIRDTVLVQITGTTRGAVTEVVLDPAVETASGLRMVSYAVCNNLLTADQSLAVRRMGKLSAKAMRAIEAKVKTALELP